MATDAGDRLDRLADQLAARISQRLDDRPLLSAKEVGNRLGVSERLARGLIADGVIPSIMVEGARRVEAAAVDAYIAGRRGGRS